MPTQNSTQTYEMLKTYLDETADSFEKLDEEPGFLYRKTDGRTSLVFCARVDKELGFLLLSAYPGILVRTSYVPMVADYCQRITPEVGALRSLSAGVLPEALPEPQEIHIPSPAPSHAEDFLPLMEEYFQKTYFTVLAKHAPDETGACYLYEFLAAHRRWKLHVTLNDEKTFFILRLFPGRNALVFDPRYLHAAAQICNAENDSVKSGALFVGRRPEGLCAKMALSALEVPTSLEKTLYSAVSILVSLLYSREAELQKAAVGVIFPTGLDVEKLKPSASDRKKRLEDAQRFLAMTARPKPLDPASAEKEFNALFGGDIAETDDDDPEPFR